MNEDIIRRRLTELLKGGNAHMTFGDAVENFPDGNFNTIFPNGTYSFWHLLEHIRRTQNDILEFIVNLNYQYKEWPRDYWPQTEEKANQKKWDETIKNFYQDNDSLIKIVRSPKSNLYAKIKWGEGQDILREILLVSDHNAYHIGEFAIMRQVLDLWDKNRR